MIFNEALGETLSGTFSVELPSADAAVFRYDAMKNRVTAPPQEKTAAGGSCTARVRLALSPYESAVLFAALPDEMADAGMEADSAEIRRQELGTDLSEGWEIWLAKPSDEPEFAPFASVGTLQPVSAALPAFSGIMSYRKDVEIADPEGVWRLEAGHLYEVGRVLVNGEEADVRLVPPYCFDLTGKLRAGHNHLEVEVANTPLRDVLNYDQSPFGHEKGIYEPSGMFGHVRLVHYI